MSKPKEPEKQQFQFSEEIIDIRKTPTKTIKTVQLTYWTDTTPPRTLWVPAEGYDDKARAKAIAEDQEKLKAVKTGTVTV